MSDESFQINQHNANFAALELLIQVYSRQEALINLVVSKLVERGEDEGRLLKYFNEDYIAAKKKIMNLLYEDFGNLDLKDFFPSGGKD